MQRASRWIMAAPAAALAVALTASPAAARTQHGRAHTNPPATANPPAPPAGPPAPAAAARPPVERAQRPAHGKAGTPAIVLDTNAVQAVLGKVVRSSAGEDMGRLVDVVVDRDGQPRAAIIDFGGFLGVGSRKIAGDWGVLNFSRSADKGVITVELTRDQVKSAPAFKEGSPVVVLGALAKPSAAAATP